MAHKMHKSEGVPYRLWVRIKQELAQKGITQRDLVTKSGIPASTINGIRTATLPTQARVVHALADALGIDREEALELAGWPSTRPGDVDVRDAIRRASEYDDRQRQMLLDLVDMLDEANRSRKSSG